MVIKATKKFLNLIGNTVAYTDLRRGIDGLAGIVQAQFQMDPFQQALFLFCGRRRDRLKALYWAAMASCCCTSDWRAVASSGCAAEMR